MTLHRPKQVGVRELHDRLSEHLERVEQGVEYIVTRRGRPVARLAAVDQISSLDALVERGLVTAPVVERRAQAPRIKADGPVADLVADQRR